MTDAGLTLMEYAENHAVIGRTDLSGNGGISARESRQNHCSCLPGSRRLFVTENHVFVYSTYSDITVELQTRTDEEIERLVRMGSIDIGMTLQPPDDHFSFQSRHSLRSD